MSWHKRKRMKGYLLQTKLNYLIQVKVSFQSIMIHTKKIQAYKDLKSITIKMFRVSSRTVTNSILYK